MTSYVKRSLAVAVALALSGCGALNERDGIRSASVEGNQKVQDSLAQLRQEDLLRSAAVREFDGVWLGGKTVKVSRDAELPAVFSQPIRFSFPDKPALNVFADRISKITNLSVRVSPDALVPIQVFTAQRMGSAGGGAALQAPSPVTMSVPMSGTLGQSVPSLASMSGMGGGGYTAVPQGEAVGRSFFIDQASPAGATLSELLDQKTAEYGVGWDFKDGIIQISRLVTRTYQIATITDINDVTSTIAKTSTTGGNDSGGDSVAKEAGKVSSNSDVSAKMTAGVDVVKNLRIAIEGTLTPNSIGKYSISDSGVVTVTDTREVQEQVEELINAENKSVSRQVRMRMQIVDLTATTNNDMGVNWAWLINNAASKWNVNLFSPAGLPGASTGFGQIGVIRNGDNSTTSAFLQALATVGKVNVRKDETYPMMNNRPLSIANTENFIYPARSSSASSNNTGNNNTTVVPGVEPGQLTTGTFLNMRSSIQPNGSVIVQFSMDASMRGATNTFVNNGVTLQYPQSTANQYQIYTTIVKGETAVLAGVQNIQQQGSDRSFDGQLTPLLGGGVASSSTQRAVLILLTPQVVEGVN
ncbi:type IVB pilus formation outer membrane protein, R64 PilN family [Pseudomonas coleopterorum]|nr:type IVB pilus formation outer membrane protein, R64 PilN family [Pseudomonas coleopterorum]